MEVRRTNAALQRITGQKPTLMRPPYAARTQRTDKVVGANGLAVVVWEQLTGGLGGRPQHGGGHHELTVQRASRDSILLMHDIHLWTVDTAAPTIDTLQKQGYTLVTVSQLLGSTKPGKLYPAA